MVPEPDNSIFSKPVKIVNQYFHLLYAGIKSTINKDKLKLLYKAKLAGWLST